MMTKDEASKVAAKKVTVTNPYARKKQSQPSTANANTAATPSPAPANGLPAATSFSQAFSSVEDTEYYQKEISSWKSKSSVGGSSVISVMNDADMEARAQQRAFDASAASMDGTPEKSAEKTMSDRDHHVMLQPHVLHVSTKQRGNGLLKFIRNVPFAYSKMVPDYIMTSSRCALFLSCKYHNLYPNYIHRRIAELKTDFTLRLLLVLVDVEDNANTLLFLNKLAVTNNLMLVLAWSEEEAARYLETYKAFDGKDASSIQRREQTHFSDQVADVLGTVRSVNKTDSATLLSQFSSLKAIAAASEDELSLVTGLGEKKVRRLHDAFHKPFSSRAAKRRKEEGATHTTTTESEVPESSSNTGDNESSSLKQPAET